MNTIALVRPPAVQRPAPQRSDAGDDASLSAPRDLSFGAMVSEVVPLLGAVAGYGPPIISLGAPWLFLALMLSGPFAFLVILVVVMLAAAALLAALTAAVVAIVAAPFVLVRRARHAAGAGHAAQLLPVDAPRVVA